MPSLKTFKSEPMPWGHANRIVNNISEILAFRFQLGFFGGSYIRRSAKCGDIDLALLPDPNTRAALDELWVAAGYQILTNGEKQKRWVLDFGDRPFQLDIWIVDSITKWGPLCMFVAGNGVLNIKQRQLATKAGYVLSQYGVTRDGVSCGDFPTEQSVYDFFGWQWIPYQLRSISF